MVYLLCAVLYMQLKCLVYLYEGRLRGVCMWNVHGIRVLFVLGVCGRCMSEI